MAGSAKVSWSTPLAGTRVLLAMIAVALGTSWSSPGAARPPRAAVPACPAGATPIPMIAATAGPFASLAAFCDAHLATEGSDAPRRCRVRRGTARAPRLRRSPGAAIFDVRIVEKDDGGDYVTCDVLLETARGWYAFEGPVCDNLMSDARPYRFSVNGLRRLTRTDGSGAIAMTFTVLEGERGHVIGGRFLRICAVGDSGEPACGEWPVLLGRGAVLDFATRLRPDGVLEVGDVSARAASGQPLTMDEESGKPSFTLTNGLSTPEWIEAHRPGLYCP